MEKEPSTNFYSVFDFSQTCGNTKFSIIKRSFGGSDVIDAK